MRDYNQSNLETKTLVKDNYTEIQFTGDLDHLGLESTRERLELTVDDLQQDNLIFNFTNLEFVNSEGIGFIIMLHSRLVKRNKNLIIVGMKDHVEDVLNVIGVTKIIKHFVSTEEWLKQN